jgi:iron complex transport system substrate-binding protein
MRIASLLATGTEIVYALGMGESVVAISHECDYPPNAQSKPRISRPRFDPAGRDSGEIDRLVRETMVRYGSVYEVDAVLLRDLAPDLLLAQAVCDVCAVPTTLAREAASALDEAPAVISLDAHTIDGILRSVRVIGEAIGVAERADAVIAAMQGRIDVVQAAVARAPRPAVLVLEWLDPPFLPGHWTPEMIELAGGHPLLAQTGAPSRRVRWEELTVLDPDVLLVVPCGYGLDAARRDADRHSARLSEVASRALRDQRGFVADGSAYFNRSGPRVVDGIEILAALLHPDRFAGVALEGRADRWMPGGQEAT